MSVDDFYNTLTPYFHLVYPDWDQSIARQAGQLNSVVREFWGQRAKRVFDATCGIGTQALGLSQIGYEVTATDISAGAVARAEREAAARGVRIDLSVADVRDLSRFYGREFDVAISCDNSLPHLLSDDEIFQALTELYHCTRAEGGLVVSVRDYASMNLSENQVIPYGLRVENGRRYLVFQVWDVSGCIYDVHMYLVEDDGEECKTRVMRTKYYAISTDRLIELARDAGYRDVRRLDDLFFQPLIVGTKSK